VIYRRSDGNLGRQRCKGEDLCTQAQRCGDLQHSKTLVQWVAAVPAQHLQLQAVTFSCAGCAMHVSAMESSICSSLAGRSIRRPFTAGAAASRRPLVVTAALPCQENPFAEELKVGSVVAG
jgi:hypothetical protein